MNKWTFWTPVLETILWILPVPAVKSILEKTAFVGVTHCQRQAHSQLKWKMSAWLYNHHESWSYVQENCIHCCMTMNSWGKSWMKTLDISGFFARLFLHGWTQSTMLVMNRFVSTISWTEANQLTQELRGSNDLSFKALRCGCVSFAEMLPEMCFFKCLKGPCAHGSPGQRGGHENRKTCKDYWQLWIESHVNVGILEWGPFRCGYTSEAGTLWS